MIMRATMENRIVIEDEREKAFKKDINFDIKML